MPEPHKSDLKYFIKKVTDILLEMGQYIENPSPLQVAQMYEAAFNKLGISSNSATNRQRRGGMGVDYSCEKFAYSINNSLTFG